MLKHTGSGSPAGGVQNVSAGGWLGSAAQDCQVGDLREAASHASMPTWQRHPKPEWWFCTVHMGCLVIAPVLTLSASGQIHSVRRSPGLGS